MIILKGESHIVECIKNKLHICFFTSNVTKHNLVIFTYIQVRIINFFNFHNNLLSIERCDLFNIFNFIYYVLVFVFINQVMCFLFILIWSHKVIYFCSIIFHWLISDLRVGVDYVKWKKIKKKIRTSDWRGMLIYFVTTLIWNLFVKKLSIYSNLINCENKNASKKHFLFSFQNTVKV